MSTTPSVAPSLQPDLPHRLPGTDARVSTRGELLSRSSRRILSAIAVATVASTLAACGGSDDGGSSEDGGGAAAANEASDIGITEDTIKLGAHFPLTGVAAPGYSEIPTGPEA